MQEKEEYITIKDHKEDFPNKISCPLINPSRSGISKISKVIFDKINNIVQSKTSVNQWKDTLSVTKRFMDVKNKKSSSFIVFDIRRFYPSVSEDLFKSAIQFAKESIAISSITIYH